ncbi:MAG TPA: hypothetical protein PLN94_09230, partial [Thiolinea sp.]|nr:hypothetical protein [Thiolinea sp.]
AVYRQRRITKRITIAEGQARSLDFQVSEFEGVPPEPPARPPAGGQSAPQQTAQQPSQPAAQVPSRSGVLQLIAVNGVDQQPLPVSFSVLALNGQLLRNFEGVAFAELSMAPQDVLVNIDYRGMHGQERIRVTPGEPTVFTFTITPNNVANPVGQQPQPPQSLEGLLMDRLQQELQRHMR